MDKPTCTHKFYWWQCFYLLQYIMYPVQRSNFPIHIKLHPLNSQHPLFSSIWLLVVARLSCWLRVCESQLLIRCMHMAGMAKRRYCILPTRHCFQWDYFVHVVMWVVCDRTYCLQCKIKKTSEIYVPSLTHSITCPKIFHWKQCIVGRYLLSVWLPTYYIVLSCC